MTWETSTSEHGMAHLAEEAVRAGRTRLVGVGGDGTHHDILNGIIAAGKIRDVVYAPLPLGSGNDWVRTLKTPRRPEDWIGMVRAGKTMEHAVGQLTFGGEIGREDEQPRGDDGQRGDGPPCYGKRLSGPETRYFINVAGLAYDAEVVRHAEAVWYKHRLLYPLMTLAFLRHFTAPTVRIDYNGISWTGPVHTVNFGIGRYNGGGMRLVPHADPAANTLALTFAERLPLWKILKESWRFYTDTIGEVKEVTLAHAASVTVTPLSGRLEAEADGEWLGAGSISVNLLEERLTVVV